MAKLFVLLIIFKHSLASFKSVLDHSLLVDLFPLLFLLSGWIQQELWISGWPQTHDHVPQAGNYQGYTSAKASCLAHTEHFQAHPAILVFSPTTTSQLTIRSFGSVINFYSMLKQDFLKPHQNKLAHLKIQHSEEKNIWKMDIFCT